MGGCSTYQIRKMVGIADIYANKTAGVYAHHKAVG